ncbi:MAG TPA: MEDS domain-containing protein, partial [Candidatus Thermoplasmatota archaeon]|nr:MEDS domain-containing protein [Candidatus Thermoplasmatota archaeon]
SPHRHVVELYRDEAALARSVARWVAPALRGDGTAVLIGTPAHLDAVRERLRGEGDDVDGLERAGVLRGVDADALLARFLVDGMPDAAEFKRLARGLLREVRGAGGAGPLHAWGEMVNLLWARGNLPAAQALEALWNEVLAEEGGRLLCSYGVDNLAPGTHEGLLRDVCAGHSYLVPEPDEGRFETAVARALADVFGGDAPRVRAMFAARRSLPVGMPAAEAVLVALHEVQPQLGRRVLASARAHLASLR